MTILDRINEPADIKVLDSAERVELAADVRHALLNKVSKYGGHTGPNLGVVEMTIALHYVFNSPKDKFVWDVSHQTYPHKILTGRKIGFEDGHFKDITPYTSQLESKHDFFTVGHTSTSIANAMGLAKARDLVKDDTDNVIAIIGDGSLSGGLALEALNNAGEYDKNLIIIANDNQMSIAENHGGMYKSLAELRETNGESSNNLFKAFGLDYRYLADGNDIDALIALFEDVKGIDHPIVLHINTEKGHGYEPAVENKEAFHWHSPFDLATGESAPRPAKRSYTTVLNDYMEKQIQVGQPIVAINAGIPGNNNLQYIEKNYPDHYLDAGIAEQFTITYGGAAALGGARPFIFHSSTFVQRAYDQFWHDLAINKEPAIVIVKGMSISASDETHQGSSALTWLSNIPNLNVLTPTSEEELVAILDWAMGQHTEPVVIVLPEHGLESRPTALTDFSTPKFTVAKAGSRVAVLGLGGLFAHAEKVVAAFTDAGIDATLVNPIFASQLDAGLLDQLAESHDVIVTMEDGIVEGGFGPKVAAYLGSRDVRVLTLGAAKEFNEEVPVAELYERYHLTPEQVVADVKDLLD